MMDVGSGNVTKDHAKHMTIAAAVFGMSARWIRDCWVAQVLAIAAMTVHLVSKPKDCRESAER